MFAAAVKPSRARNAAWTPFSAARPACNGLVMVPKFSRKPEAMLAAGVYCLLTGFGSRNGPDFTASWQRLPSPTVTGPLVGGLFTLGVLAALVCAFAL